MLGESTKPWDLSWWGFICFNSGDYSKDFFRSYFSADLSSHLSYFRMALTAMSYFRTKACKCSSGSLVGKMSR